MSSVGATGGNALQAYYLQSAATADDTTTDPSQTSTDPDASNKDKPKPAPAPAPAPAGTIFASALMSALIDAQSGGSSDPLMSTAVGDTSTTNTTTTDTSDLIGAQANAQVAAQQDALLSHLTPSDRALVAAAGVTLPDPSDPNSIATPQPLPPFVLQIAADRASGRLTGDITQGYWQGLESRSSTGQEMAPQVFSDGLAYLQDKSVSATASS